MNQEYKEVLFTNCRTIDWYSYGQKAQRIAIFYGLRGKDWLNDWQTDALVELLERLWQHKQNSIAFLHPGIHDSKLRLEIFVWKRSSRRSGLLHSDVVRASGILLPSSLRVESPTLSLVGGQRIPGNIPRIFRLPSKSPSVPWQLWHAHSRVKGGGVWETTRGEIHTKTICIMQFPPWFLCVPSERVIRCVICELSTFLRYLVRAVVIPPIKLTFVWWVHMNTP